MIFSISHPDLPAHSFVMGTMHSRDSRAFTYYAKAIELMKQCAVFGPEMNTTLIDTVQWQQAFTLPPELVLDQVWAPGKYSKKRAMLRKAFGLDLDALKGVSPVFIQGLMMASCLGSEQPQTLDQMLLDNALQQGMAIKGIESPEDQYAIAKSLDAGIQIQQLDAMLGRPDKFRHHAHKLAMLYANNELTPLYQLGKRGLGAFRQILLYDRNQRMAEAIHHQIRQAGNFVAIGAAHLPGQKGVLRLLKQRGYKVTAVD